MWHGSWRTELSGEQDLELERKRKVVVQEDAKREVLR